MSQNLRDLTTAMFGFEHVLKLTPKKALRMKSPCDGWKGADVIAHVFGAVTAVHRAATGGAMPKSPPKLSDDLIVQWERLRDKTLASLDQPDVLRSTSDTYMGPTEVDTFIGVMGADVLVHTWDLARTAKVDDRLDPKVCVAAHKLLKAFPDEIMRQPGLFGPAITPPKGADAQTKLLNFLGREV